MAFRASIKELARELAIDRSGVSRALALIDLSGPVVEKVESGELAASVARNMTGTDFTAEVKARQAEAPSEGKPKARAKKITARSSRTPAGPRVTVEWGRGLQPGTIAEALGGALADAEKDAGQGDEQACDALCTGSALIYINGQHRIECAGARCTVHRAAREASDATSAMPAQGEASGAMHARRGS